MPPPPHTQTKVNVHTVNAFAKNPEGGNPAGVVLDADDLTEIQMLQVAKIVGFSETAFVSQSEKADFRVRFFTPKDEVDLCGHATIATFYLLAQKGVIQDGHYTQETKAGVLGIHVKDRNTIFMAQSPPEFLDEVSKEDVVQVLGLKESDLLPKLPCQIVSTALKDIFVPVKDLSTLQRLQPDMNRMSEMSKAYGVIGFHVFSLESQFGGIAQTRNFAPLYGIPEESATGTANGALSAYMHQHGVVDKSQAKHLVFEQGYSMENHSESLAQLTIHEGEITTVQVGGTAVAKGVLLISL